MDFESKYNELVEAARAVVEGNPGLCKTDKGLGRLSKLLPEKESEDERIRKEIIEFIDWAESRGSVRNDWHQKKRPAEWIAYLERQKEQKFIDYPHVPGWRKNRDGNKPKLKHSVLMLTTHGVAEGEWLGEKWCQYRWSCELKDNEILYWIHLSDLTQLEKEDEIIEKEQKPAEWSEEDEKILKDCIDMPYCADFISMERKKDAIRWLKSLRPQPHWKPSDEQMKALEHCVNGWQDTADGVLESLYNDLKKL